MIYILQGKNTGIKVVFKYNLNGLLKAMEIDGEYEELQLKYLFWNAKFPFPYTEAMIEDVRKLGSFTITRVEEDLSFERFWETYRYKVSGKRARLLWEKLSNAKRIMVFEHLPKYEAYLQRKGIEKAYPDSYLSKEKFYDQY